MTLADTTTCDRCGGQVHRLLDQALEMRAMRLLQYPHCGDRLVRLKHPHELDAVGPDRAA